MKKSTGFTLVEIMMVIALMAILLTFAAPNMASLVDSNRVTEASNQLVSALNLARSEAIRQSKPILVSGLSEDASNGATWNSGWHLWIDNNNNQKFDRGIDTEIYSFSNEVTRVNTSNAQKVVEYLPTGYVTGAGGNSISFSICTNSTGSKVDLAQSGFITVQSQPCGS